MTDKQESYGRIAAKAILKLQRTDEIDEAFARRVGLTSGKAQVGNMKAGGGVNLATIVNVAKKTGYSVDSLLGLKEGSDAQFALGARYAADVAARAVDLLGQHPVDEIDLVARPGDDDSDDKDDEGEGEEPDDDED